jgi:hypothetical protein
MAPVFFDTPTLKAVPAAMQARPSHYYAGNTPVER